MTVKSPFYNKPSTLTSVDSCHKCPLIQPKENNSFGDFQCDNKVQSTGFDQLKDNTASINNHQIIEPCNSSVAKSDIGNHAITSCSNCGTTSTPLWRRSPLGETICNACGLYLKARNTTRPVWLKRNSTAKRTLTTANKNIVALAPRIISPPPLLAPAPANKNLILVPQQQQQQQQQQAIAKEDTANLICANCQTTTTPLWRRDEIGQPICNACGLYFKLHSVHRPITMKRSTIKRRKRVTAATLVTHKPLMIHRQSMTPNDFCGMKRKLSTDSKRTTEQHLRPLLPSPIQRPPTPPMRRSSPDPIEPDVHHKQYYLPSPPMKPTNNIACLLNPQVDKQDRSLPGLPPSPPLLPMNDDFLYDRKHTQEVLEAHRNELKREVTNLTSLLSRTTAMLQNIDHAIAVNHY